MWIDRRRRSNAGLSQKPCDRALDPLQRRAAATASPPERSSQHARKAPEPLEFPPLTEEEIQSMLLGLYLVWDEMNPERPGESAPAANPGDDAA
jgi:hypothetical protein